MNSVYVTIKFLSENQVETLKRILELEVSQNVSQRAKVSINKDGLFLKMSIISEDIVALRAFYNSMLRLLRSSVRIQDEISPKD